MLWVAPIYPEKDTIREAVAAALDLYEKVANEDWESIERGKSLASGFNDADPEAILAWNKRMAELVANGPEYDGPVYISQSECIEDAQDVANAIKRDYPHLQDGEVHIFPIGATIGCHTGPGTVALFFWGNPTRW